MPQLLSHVAYLIKKGVLKMYLVVHYIMVGSLLDIKENLFLKH